MSGQGWRARQREPMTAPEKKEEGEGVGREERRGN